MPQTEQPEIFSKKCFLESANDSARHFSTIYTVYLILLFYTAVTILSTDQELLFRASGKQLPVININVPIVEFYTIMPWGLFIIHFYLLIQASFLADKVRLYLNKLEKSGAKNSDGERKLLFPVPLAHTLTGVRGQQILRWIVVISLIIFPIELLIVAQITFLPYQSELITWQHRIVIMLDIGLLWYFWNRRIFPVENNKLKENGWWRQLVFTARLILLTLTLLIIVFIVIVVDFPSPETSDWIQKMGASKVMPNHFELSEYKLVKREPSPEILAAYHMKGTEQTSDENADKESSIEPGSATWCKSAESLDLKNRNFRKADLRGAILCGAKLSGTDFNNADLVRTNLTGADLRRATLISADLEDADLTGADLGGANLTGADLGGANLTGADLGEADGADLRGANLTDCEGCPEMVVVPAGSFTMGSSDNEGGQR